MSRNSKIGADRTAAKGALLTEALEVRRLMSFSTAAPPYVIPTAPGVEVDPILTVGDAVPETDAATDRFDGPNVPQDGVYRMVGIPDGLGAFDNGDGTFTVLMNHELGPTQGTVRDHGSTGAFVSRWVLRKSDLKVISGDDQIKRVFLRDPGTGRFGPATTWAFNRLCSADLAEQTAFFDPRSGRGTRERIFLNGEETRPPGDIRHGKAFAHVVTGRDNGDSFELNELGEMAFENVVASPFPQRKTVVMSLDDSTNAFTANANPPDPTGAATQPSEVYVYVGEKRSTGNVVERAGLVGGGLFGVQVIGDPNEATVTGGERFNLVAMSKPAQDDGVVLQAESVSKQVTQFRRVEDGHWDPTNPNDFYYVTTDSFGGQTRLWRLRFDDVTRPESGGTIDLMYSASPGHVEGGAGPETEPRPGEMFDNMTVDSEGRILLQEDVGNNAHLGRIWLFDKDTRTVTELARHNPDLFLTPPVKTLDEESSGIIDISDIVGEGTYLFDVQAHVRLPDPELVEDGQFLAMTIDFDDLSGDDDDRDDD